MNTKQKGTALELLVTMLEKHLSKIPDTIVKTNVLLPDRDDINRQIDVYVEYTVNKRKNIMIIECKHYDNPVSIGIIGQFNDLCTSLNANKKVFVTTNTYASGAIKKARANDIDICTIEEQDVNNSPDELQHKTAYLLKLEYQITSVSFRSEELQIKFPNIPIQPNCQFYQKYRKKKINVLELVKKFVDSNPEPINKLFYSRMEDGFTITANKIIPHQVNIKKKDDLFVKYNNKYWLVDQIIVDINFWLEVAIQKSQNWQIYKSFSTGEEFATFISTNFTSNEKTFSLNTVKSEDGVDLYVIDEEDESKVIKLNKLGKIDKLTIHDSTPDQSTIK